MKLIVKVTTYAEDSVEKVARKPSMFLWSGIVEIILVPNQECVYAGLLETISDHSACFFPWLSFTVSSSKWSNNRLSAQWFAEVTLFRPVFESICSTRPPRMGAYDTETMFYLVLSR